MIKLHVFDINDANGMREVESTGEIVDTYYERTDHGPILSGLLWPIECKEQLQAALAARAAARDAYSDTMKLFYAIKR